MGLFLVSCSTSDRSSPTAPFLHLFLIAHGLAGFVPTMTEFWKSVSAIAAHCNTLRLVAKEGKEILGGERLFHHAYVSLLCCLYQNERYYCDVCMCWMDAHARTRKLHEAGKTHQEKFLAKQKALRAEKAAAASKETQEAKQWAELDKAAQAAYERDLIAQGKAIPSAAAAPSTSTAAAGYGPPPATKPRAAHYPSHPLASTAAAAAAPSLATPPAAVAAVSTSPWQATVDPRTGATYYYNVQTLATTWERPAELDAAMKTAAVKAEEPQQEQSKKERKRTNASIAHAERAATAVEATAAGEGESKEGDAASAKRQKTTDAAESVAATAAPAPAPPAAAVEIDEDTGMGKWATVEAPPEPTAAEIAAAAAASSVPRRTPFGSAATPAETPQTSTRWAASRHAADDAEDADDDGTGVVGAAAAAAAATHGEELRAQFGPSALLRTRNPAGKYEQGTDLLDARDPELAAQEAIAAAGGISFKKKRDRSANARKPVPVTNK
jgi:hypothetical protein